MGDEAGALELKMLLLTRGRVQTSHGLQRHSLGPQCGEPSGQFRARPRMLLPAVLRVILPHVLNEVGFLQAFVSW